MQDTVKNNLLQIQEDIAPYKPNIIAVTKYFDESAIIEAYNAGLRDFAESRVIEARRLTIFRRRLEIIQNSILSVIFKQTKLKRLLELLIIFILLIHSNLQKLYLTKLIILERLKIYFFK